MNTTAQPSDHPKDARLATPRQINDWFLQLNRLERLLRLASHHLGEAIPYVDAAKAGIDDVDAFIEACAAIAAQLSWEIIHVDAPDEA